MKRLVVPVLLCCTLGLAPLLPEPHLWKQFLNLSQGRPMAVLDWVDVVMHGAPFVWLVVEIVRWRSPA